MLRIQVLLPTPPLRLLCTPAQPMPLPLLTATLLLLPLPA
jgi:hypothetical protein